MRWQIPRRYPLLWFAILGSVLFGLSHAWDAQTAVDSIAQRSTLRISSDRVGRAIRDFEQQHGYAPGPAVRLALINALVRDEVLFREALRLGLDQGDSSVSRRLLEKYRLVARDPNQSDQRLIEEARTLGWIEHDIVVRRVLVERMRRLLSQGPGRRVQESEIEAVIEEAGDTRMDPAVVSFEHLFLGSEDSAEKFLAELDGQSPSVAQMEDVSLPFALGLEFKAQNRVRITSRFGDDFADAIFSAPVGKWGGPVESTYGLHLVRVISMQPSVSRPASETRQWATRTISRRRATERLRRSLDWLESAYRVEVDDPIWRNEREGTAGQGSS